MRHSVKIFFIFSLFFLVSRAQGANEETFGNPQRFFHSISRTSSDFASQVIVPTIQDPNTWASLTLSGISLTASYFYPELECFKYAPVATTTGGVIGGSVGAMLGGFCWSLTHEAKLSPFLGYFGLNGLIRGAACGNAISFASMGMWNLFKTAVKAVIKE